MNDSIPLPSIGGLPARVAALRNQDRALFDRLFQLSVAEGRLVPPPAMESWIAGHFGSVDAVRRQQIIRVTNRVTLDGVLFNTLRSSRPVEAPSGSGELEETISGSAGGPFCRPEEGTPADSFGRIRGRSSITASNVAKYDGWHAVIVFDEHHPLRFTADEVADYIDTAQRWAAAAHQVDPQARYPFFLWNCLWRSGASILHGHAQMTLTRDMHYARVEAWRQAAARYAAAHTGDYFDDLMAIHDALDLAVPHGSATILPSLTPFKEMETQIIAPALNDDLKSAVYTVLHTLVERMGSQSFNLTLYQPPLSATPEDWDGFPYLVRVLDRGRLDSRTSDVGAMEIFAQSVVSTDPYRVADALRQELSGQENRKRS